MIVAMDERRVIGHAGRIPWNHPEDRLHFRRATLHHAVIMGRGTYSSIGRPLPMRHNIVISRHGALSAAGCEVARSLTQAIQLARQKDPEPMIIGGAQVYAEALPLATRIYLTEIPGQHSGDTYFPSLRPDDWRETSRHTLGKLTFITLESPR
ncbi:MAG: dihydrofolate reductase [Myxococcales bacterium]|nr:dihydrofolate reductase [Myxococcales bacterium]